MTESRTPAPTSRRQRGLGARPRSARPRTLLSAQKRPEQERCSDEDGAMKERFEIVLCQKTKTRRALQAIALTKKEAEPEALQR